MKELKFIHITKTGGTSIEKSAFKHNIRWGRYDKEYKDMADIDSHHQTWHNILQNKEYRIKYDWFMIVRNPYTRLLSEYNCIWGGIGKSNDVHNVEQMNRYLIKRILFHYKPYNKGEYTATMAPGHYRVQSEYLISGTKLYVLKFESIDSHFEKLLEMYNIPNFELERHNTAESNNKKKRFTIDDFSKELITLINKVYHKDFVNFGYDKM